MRTTLYKIKLSWHRPAKKMEGFFFHIEEIKKKEVSETERKRERSQTASSAWGAAILEKCREQRWDCNAVKSSYIQHTQPSERFFFFSPKWWKQRENKGTGVNQKQMNEKLEFKTWKHLTWDQSDRVLSVAEEEEDEEEEEEEEPLY